MDLSKVLDYISHLLAAKFYAYCLRIKAITSVYSYLKRKKQGVKVNDTSATLLNKRLWQGCFLVNFAKFLRTPFSQNTSGLLLLENSRTMSKITAK